MWIYNGIEIKTFSQITNILGYAPYGFIYQFNFENSFYIGQKTLKTDAKRIIGAKELKEKGKSSFRKYKSKKGKKRGQWIYFEEGKQETWLDYNSSSDIVKEMITEGVPYTKEILKFVKHKSLMNYLEMKEVICAGCMETEDCLNLRIGNNYSSNIIKALNKK